MVNFADVEKSLKAPWVSRYCSSDGHHWCALLDSHLEKFGGSFLFQCNYDLKFLDLEGLVNRLGKLPSKEQQLSRTQHFILKAHAAIIVLHKQYGPRGTSLTPMIQRQNCLLSTVSPSFIGTSF